MINDKEIALKMIKEDGYSVAHFSNELMDDREFVLKIIKYGEYILEHVSKRLQDDKEIVLKCVKINGTNLEYASSRLQNDKEVVIEAIKNDIYDDILNYPTAYEFASGKLQKDIEIQKLLLTKISSSEYNYILNRIKYKYKDKELMDLKIGELENVLKTSKMEEYKKTELLEAIRIYYPETNIMDLIIESIKGSPNGQLSNSDYSKIIFLISLSKK